MDKDKEIQFLIRTNLETKEEFLSFILLNQKVFGGDNVSDYYDKLPDEEKENFIKHQYPFIEYINVFVGMIKHDDFVNKWKNKNRITKADLYLPQIRDRFKELVSLTKNRQLKKLDVDVNDSKAVQEEKKEYFNKALHEIVFHIENNKPHIMKEDNRYFAEFEQQLKFFHNFDGYGQDCVTNLFKNYSKSAEYLMFKRNTIAPLKKKDITVMVSKRTYSRMKLLLHASLPFRLEGDALRIITGFALSEMGILKKENIYFETNKNGNWYKYLNNNVLNHLNT